MSTVTVNKGSFDKNSRTRDGYKRIGQSERIVSLLAGTLLTGSALRSRGLMNSALMLGAAAGLIHRGATGKCGFAKASNKVNQMLNSGMEKLSTAMDEHRQTGSEHHDQVSEASDESFPASDAPSFTPVTGESASHMNK